MKKYISFIALMFFLSGCASYTSIRSKSGNECALKGGRVIILPPKVEVNLLDTSNKKERMYDYEYFLEGVIANELANALNEQNISARVMTRRELHEAKAEEDFAKLKNSSKRMMSSLYEKPMKKEEAYNINSRMSDLPKNLEQKLKGNILAFVEYDQISKTAGLKAAGLAMKVLGALASGGNYHNNSDPDNQQAVLVYFVDATNGDLIWSNISTFFTESLAKEKEYKRIKGMIDDITKPLTISIGKKKK